MNAGATLEHNFRRGPLAPPKARRTAFTRSFKSFAPPRERAKPSFLLVGFAQWHESHSCLLGGPRIDDDQRAIRRQTIDEAARHEIMTARIHLSLIGFLASPSLRLMK